MKYWRLAALSVLSHVVSIAGSGDTLKLLLLDFLPIQIICYALISTEQNANVPGDAYQ
jgi:hypothetical protein